jgi:hypothetical protein
MGGFQKIILVIMFILLIVVLVLVGITLYKKNAKQSWPPNMGDCPDYWLDMSGNGARCVNVKDLGTCNGSVSKGQHLTMDFSVAPYVGSEGTCSKYNWANSCGIAWDGITYGVPNPCVTDSNPKPSSGGSSYK